MSVRKKKAAKKAAPASPAPTQTKAASRQVKLFGIVSRGTGYQVLSFSVEELATVPEGPENLLSLSLDQIRTSILREVIT